MVYDARRNLRGGPSGEKYRNTVARNLEAAKTDSFVALA
jgi:hypothetical protein